MEPQWLTWAKRLNAIAQNGLTYTESGYDRDRYVEIRQIAAAILAEHTSIPATQIVDLFEQETGYRTPRIDVRVGVFQDDRVLLVHEKIDNCWAMPGGWADAGLSLRENAEKEVREEAGLIVTATRLVAVLDRNRNGHPPSPDDSYKIFVLAEPTGGSFQPNTETHAAEFFPVDNLPELSLPRITVEQIRLCLQAHRSPGFQPVFD